MKVFGSNRIGDDGAISYLTLPRQVVCLEATAIERNQQVSAAISVLKWQLRIAHFLAGRPYGGPLACAGVTVRGRKGEIGKVIRRGVSLDSNAIVCGLQWGDRERQLRGSKVGGVEVRRSCGPPPGSRTRAEERSGVNLLARPACPKLKPQAAQASGSTKK